MMSVMKLTPPLCWMELFLLSLIASSAPMISTAYWVRSEARQKKLANFNRDAASEDGTDDDTIL